MIGLDVLLSHPLFLTRGNTWHDFVKEVACLKAKADELPANAAQSRLKPENRFPCEGYRSQIRPAIPTSMQ